MKVLVAEDDDVTRSMIAEILRGEGYNVLEARDGKHAIDLWKSQAADFLLLDIMMPELSGYEVCREVRTTDHEVPVVFISAKSEEVDVVVGLELGADDFLRKPFGKHELIARLRAILRRRDTDKASTRFSLGPWTIWSRKLKASGDTGEIDLTMREVRMLELFHQRTGEVVTRDELLNECWGAEYFPESRTLDQHISNLRKKIGCDLITTIRGVGYSCPPEQGTIG
ncbi:response regulator transcription factor [Akkermansiaceae bacterium]|nr:response regulator transcription factor [Akkermansiaceae bacterium]